MDPKWITVVAMMVIGSFAIDRIVSALLFPFFREPPAPPKQTDDEILRERQTKYEREWNYKRLYFIMSGVLAIILLVCWDKMRVLEGLGYPPEPNKILDFLLTGIVLVGGADRLSGVKPGEASPAAEPEPKPLKVTGQITLVDNTTAASRR